jgi:hypothetical protein
MSHKCTFINIASRFEHRKSLREKFIAGVRRISSALKVRFLRACVADLKTSGMICFRTMGLANSLKIME